MAHENRGRETGPSMHEAYTPQTADPMFYAVLEALAGYLFCRDCDGYVVLNATPHTVSDRRHEWWQDSCWCGCSRCREQGDHYVGSCSVYSDDDSTAIILRSLIKAAADLFDALGVAAADLYEMADDLDPIEDRRLYHLAQLGYANAKKALDRHRMGSERCQCDIVGDNMPGCPVHTGADTSGMA